MFANLSRKQTPHTTFMLSDSSTAHSIKQSKEANKNIVFKNWIFIIHHWKLLKENKYLRIKLL